ncbi:hybrid sensor histidine kinase/response regulator transcription factor [Flavivirga algicola]|uniref:histidine kinase n=1 Tax=Flavivirga algicola TaxID=2729136 RepID=A0ABX1RR37_9FLAO|nr:hybrid sensor histidine kinase/response regulator transcription factor [Flavivirga algicola]NMH86024.1 response regulator [Flavivirga algicola]
MRIKFVIISVFFFLFNFIPHAQSQFSILENNTLKFEKLKPKEGLFHNSVTTIFQDSKGYMWFGSFNGLYKYDGYRFQLYKKNIDDDSSLIGNDILSIHEDHNGKLWIGTKNGLCWYDRNTDNFFTNIPLTDASNFFSISNVPNCIYEDSYKTLWVGTNTGLYQLIKNGKGYNIAHYKNNDKKGSLSHNVVKSITEDKNNNLWIATKNGLNKVSINRQGKLHFEHFKKNNNQKEAISNNYVTKLFTDSNDNIWIGTKNGLNKLTIDETNTSKFIKYFHKDNNQNSLPDNYITALSEDSNGNLWIGTRYGGLSKLDKSENTFTNYKKNLRDENSLSSNEVSSIFEDHSGTLWIGAISGALNKVILTKKNIAHFKFNAADNKSLSDNIINNIYEDRFGSIWIGTHNGGLNKLILKGGNVSFVRYKHDNNNKNSISGDNVFSICEDNHGNLWVGTEDNGLNQIKHQKNSEAIEVISYAKETSDLPSNNISIMLKDKTGDIWMGSFDGDGLMKFSPKEFGAKLPKIEHFETNPTSSKGLSSNNISYLFEDSKGNLWVGTYGGGLIRIIRNSNNSPIKYITIKNKPKDINSLSNNNVFSIHEDIKGNIWVATFGGGLNKIPSKELKQEHPKIVRFNSKHGLTNDELYGILDDKKGDLWISSNNGIYRFNPEKETFINYNTYDGLQAFNYRKFAFCKGSNGLMYFGGINGFNAFDPSSFSPNRFLPKVEIVDFKIFNESIKAGEEIEGHLILNKSISETSEIVLNYSLNAFSFEFSGLHYASPDQNKYLYKLEGFDKTWNKTDSKRRYAAYSNLDPGNYIFKVKASNNDNIWNETIKELKIKVLPLWWKTWWAYTIYGLMTIGLMLLFRHFIVVNQDYQNKLKIEKLEQENIKRINTVKLEFFTNISHEFKTPLTLILGPLQHLISSKRVDGKVKNMLVSIERNANNLYNLINQVLEFRKIDTNEVKINATKGDLISFIKEIVNSFYFLAENQNIKLTFQSDASDLESFFDWDKLEKIINNLISNCIKYTPEGGNVDVNLQVETTKNKNDNSIKIVVKDTGVGIPKNQVAFIFNRFYQIDSSNRSSSMGSGIGLAYTKALVELHNGNIRVKSKEHVGSEFIVTLPLVKSYSKSRSTPNPVKNDFIDIPEPKYKQPPVLEKGKETTKENSKIKHSNTSVLLVVEDNLELQNFIKQSLGKDFKILQAYDGNEGLKKALDHVPDIILSDVMMPVKDGIQFCDDIKRNHVTNHIPIVLLTARASIEHRIEGLEVGADAYIAKPFHVKHLLVTLNNLLEQRRLLKEKFSVSIIQNKESNPQVSKFEHEFLSKIEAIISENLQNPQFGVEELGHSLNFSRMQLYRKLKSISGMSANEFIREYRIKKAAQYMIEKDLNISQIAFDVGFNNLSYFTKCFKKVYNISPSEYLKENRPT